MTLIVDNKYSKSFPIIVSARTVPKRQCKTVTLIDAPSQAMQFENVQFRAISDGKQFTWKFGETGRIDSKDKLAIYSYQNRAIMW